MFKSLGSGRSFWGFATVVLLSLPGLASAQDSDAQEIERYVLTEAGLAKFTQATQRLATLPAAATNCGDEGDFSSIAASVAQLDALPGVKATIQGAGMTTREYVVFSLSLVHNAMAAWSANQPGGKLPPGASQANVDFYNEHAAEFAALNESGQDDCDEDGEYEDDYEP